MTTGPEADDDALLDAVFDAAVTALESGTPLDLEPLIAGREHLRAEAERLLELAAGVGVAHPPSSSTRALPTVPGFTILGEVGRGGMGIVYRARQDSLGRLVALKILAPALLASKRSRERFVVEARALARLQHPNVVAVHEIVVQDDLCAYAMEWVDGTTLAQALEARDPRLDTTAIARLGVTIGRALAAVHAAGLVHRDVKPGNVLLRRDGSPLLSDFGLVRDDAHSMHTATGEFVGTTAFAAPEQLRGEHDRVGPWTDVYGLGVTLYTALAGTTPFASSSHATMLRRIEEGAAVPLQRCAAQVPRDLATIVATAIDREPARRYASADALADDLARFLAFEPIHARPASLALRAQRWLERSPQLALALAALLLTLLVGLSVAIWQALDLARQRTAAQQAEAKAVARQRDFDQLAGVVWHERAVAAERELHPPWPHRVEAMERWLRDDAGRLLAMRDGVAQTLAELQARAVAPGASSDGRSAAAPQFAVEADQFLHDTLRALAQDLDALAERTVPSVEQRLAWARRVGALTRAHPNARVSWAQARAAIAASDRYRGLGIGLRDEDVLGLVPIGPNPRTGLWEFYDLRSAWDGVADPATLPIPVHTPRDGDAGHVAVGDDTGIVFVLLPGGTFWMGAQAEDPDGPNHDPRAHPSEPLHEVAIPPFLLARHELTQGQWRRLTSGDAPSRHPAGSSNGVGGIVTAAHPVEYVDWFMAAKQLEQHGMSLPTEAQWEYGCRAGTATPWWTGADRETLRGAANLADRSAKEAGAPWTGWTEWPEFADGFLVHAPVDCLRANAFGLHHVHGNVSEWCVDAFMANALPGRTGAGRGDTVPGTEIMRVPRGGSFTTPASGARAAFRREYTPTLRYVSLGLRAARPVRVD
jgi:formylglycine-generating enzyme required for sulfatase activity